MSSRRVILFVIAGLLVIVVLYFQLIKGGPGRGVGTPTPSTVPVVVAKRDVPPYMLLSIEDVDTVRVSLGQAADAFGGLQELSGQMTTAEIRKGNIIRRADVLTRDPNWVEGEMLIFSFYVSTPRVLGGQLRSGHYVDLLVTKPGSREESAEALWLARNLWVVGVQQASGESVARPTVTLYGITPEAPKTTGGAAGGLLGGPTTGGSAAASRQGPANLVIAAAHRETAKMIGDYLGAQLYDAWVYIRPGRQPATASAGRMDGFVYAQTREEGATSVESSPKTGLDGVAVTLADGTGAVKSSLKTTSGGQFTFDGLAPGTYRVEAAIPEGYIPTTPRQLQLYVAGGQNVHVTFGSLRTASAVIVVQPTAMRPVVTPQPGATLAPQPTRPALPGVVGTATLYMSDKSNGAPVKNFREGTKEVWAVVTFKDVPKDTAYTVRVYNGTGSQERVISSGMVRGDGSEAIPIKAWLATGFETGAYMTVLQTGPENTQRDFKLWSVSGIQNVTPEPTRGTGFGNSGLEAERQR